MTHGAEAITEKTIKFGCIKIKDSCRAKPTQARAGQRTLRRRVVMVLKEEDD